jgi:hypothetical protein
LRPLGTVAASFLVPPELQPALRQHARVLHSSEEKLRLELFYQF